MPFKKLSDDPLWNEFPCSHREHDPPNMIVLEPGSYEYTCPGCGHVTYFQIPPKHYTFIS